MFQVNDTVRYGTSGVCKITEIVSRPFGGEQKQYYVLRPVHDGRSTLFVPVENEVLVAKMQQVLNQQEVMELIANIPALDGAWIHDDLERKSRFKQILNGADRVQVAGIIKALYLHDQELRSKGKKLRMDDERTFREAERLLYDEFALVLEMAPEEVLGFIKQQLEQPQPR